MIKKLIIILGIVILLTGCTLYTTPTPVVPTKIPTTTPVPTNTSTPTLEPTPTQVLCYGTVNTTANVRVGPGLEYDVQLVLEKDSDVDIFELAANQEWIRITDQGWMYADFIDVVGTCDRLTPVPTPTNMLVVP